jgi:phenylacetate-CoA ligase
VSEHFKYCPLGLLNKIYDASPVFLQNMLVSAYGYRWQKRRYGGIFETEYAAAKKREAFTANEWNAYQNEQLQKMLLHAFEQVPYYREVFTAVGFDKDLLKQIDIIQLHRLPVLSKEAVRKFGTTTLMAAKREAGGDFFSSSGSTGTPVQIYYSHYMHQRWFALNEARIKNWAGLSRFNGRGMIGGRRIIADAASKPPFYRYNYFEKQVYFSAYHISPSNIPSYFKAFQDYNIDYMTGYAVSNYILARMLGEQNLRPTPLKAVLTSSEKLTPEMRQTFADVYGCKTYDSWSGMEYCGLISECEHGSLHISPDAGVIEVLNDEMQPVAANEMGTVYCTGLLNFDQPLIRYKIGDQVILEDVKCNCGRDMPVVKEIVGRIEDVVYGKDGREMVRFHGIFVGLKTVKLSQVIQESLDELVIKIVPDVSLDFNEKNIIIQRVKSQLGDINVILEVVDDIPRTRNGKIKAVISHIKK